MPRSAVRRPKHAGSWYQNDASQLLAAINSWLVAVPETSNAQARAVISPHAGHIYCGHVMAHAYRRLDISQASRIFILGPSHHVYTPRCLLSRATSYRSPLGDIPIDQAIYQELLQTGLFDQMALEVDEAEHSLELQIPFIQAIMRGRAFTLVPIMVGALAADREAVYGQALGQYLDDPSNLFIVSSDFCHWGSRFSFTYYDSSKGDIYQSIEWLDRVGMNIIEQGRPEEFTQYLKQYGNTICGRHPIAVLLHMMQHCRSRLQLQFQQYDQSSRCISQNDSSVSYAAAVAIPIAQAPA